MIKDVCVYGGWGRMGSFHVKRLEEEHPELNVSVVDMAGGIHEPVSHIDAAIIATPSETHYEIAAELIQAGKHVLVEKPVALSYKEAQTLYRLAQEYDVVFMAGHTERFNPVFRRALTNLYGRSDIAYRRWCVNPGTDIIFDTMIHDLELALYLNNVTDTTDLKIEIEAITKNGIALAISAIGEFIVSYGTNISVREIIDIQNEKVINLLDVDKAPHDPLFYEHNHFLKLCERGGATDHAKYAVAAVGLAENIKKALNG
jgi:GFO/IDH/MocA oxidoreductase family protein